MEESGPTRPAPSGALLSTRAGRRRALADHAIRTHPRRDGPVLRPHPWVHAPHEALHLRTAASYRPARLHLARPGRSGL